MAPSPSLFPIPLVAQVDALTSCTVNALYTGGFAAGLFLAPTIFFKGGLAQYWDIALPENSALQWFAQATGITLGGLAIMNAQADEKTVDLCTAVNFVTNVLFQLNFYKALSNKDGNKAMWQIQNIVGLGMLAMSAYSYFN